MRVWYVTSAGYDENKLSCWTIATGPAFYDWPCGYPGVSPRGSMRSTPTLRQAH
jgi:hypothetical protein